jgi:hypothetical protein
LVGGRSAHLDFGFFAIDFYRVASLPAQVALHRFGDYLERGLGCYSASKEEQ